MLNGPMNETLLYYLHHHVHGKYVALMHAPHTLVTIPIEKDD